MRVLVTGFDPFGGETINPAYEALVNLPKHIHGNEIIAIELPTVFYACEKVLLEAIETYSPDIVICVGQAGGRPAIGFEKVAINLNEARIADNRGQQLIDSPILESGPTAYFTNLPIKAMVEAVKAAGYPATVSYSAGTFVCNHIFYLLMHAIATKMPHIRGGFIHVPFIEAQVVDKPTHPSMHLMSITNALEIAITTALTVEVDVLVNAGTEC